MAKKKTRPAAAPSEGGPTGPTRRRGPGKKATKPRAGTAKPRRRGAATPAATAVDTSLSSTGRMEPPRSGVTVRMYRTGLGDCFLLAFPRGEPAPDGHREAFYMLIDCGVFYATPREDNVPRIRRIAADIVVATGGRAEVKPSADGGIDVEVTAPGRLDLLVITHEHWDHVSAFHEDQARSIFEQIELKKLWMAWTENLTIPLAKNLHDGRRAMRIALARALALMPARPDAQGVARPASPSGDLVRKALEFFGGTTADAADQVEGAAPSAPDTAASPGPGLGLAAAALGAKTSVRSEDAMEWIRDTYGKGKAEFRHPGDGPLPLDGVEDTRIYILGPPEDDLLIRRYEPSARTAQVYPKAMAAAVEMSFFAPFGVLPLHLDASTDSEEVAEARELCLPFEKHYQIPDARVARALKQAEQGRQRRPDREDPAASPLFARYHDPGEAWRRIDHDWLDASGGFALQIDGATNNTSLALAIEVGRPGEGRVLLFPGDAQVGNWESWFGKVEINGKSYGKDMTWSVAGKTIDAQDLLRRTVLYKVGHHGSHNATLRERGLELMGRPDGTGELVAMLPVNEYVAQVKAGYGQMPLQSLVKDLLIRSGGRLMRNDEGDKARPEVLFSSVEGVPGAPEPLETFGTKHKTDLYIEYTVE